MFANDVIVLEWKALNLNTQKPLSKLNFPIVFKMALIFQVSLVNVLSSSAFSVCPISVLPIVKLISTNFVLTLLTVDVVLCLSPFPHKMNELARTFYSVVVLSVILLLSWSEAVSRDR